MAYIWASGGRQSSESSLPRIVSPPSPSPSSSRRARRRLPPYHAELLWSWQQEPEDIQAQEECSSREQLTGMKLKRHIDATLGSGSLREVVRLPVGEDLNEWLAVNTVDFFNQVNILYGTLMEFCTPATCPTMSASPKYEYRWADGVKIKRPIEVCAPKYVEYLMDWIEAQLDEESIFPQKLGAPFPPNFRDVIKTIFKRLFRVYAHIYHSHFQMILKLQEEAHLNTCFKHFMLFSWEFQLIDRAELAPLRELIEPILVGH